MCSDNKTITIPFGRYMELLNEEGLLNAILNAMLAFRLRENPTCDICGAGMLRWGWYEADNEAIKYWYCLECDKAGRAPYIQVRPNPDYIPEEE